MPSSLLPSSRSGGDRDNADSDDLRVPSSASPFGANGGALSHSSRPMNPKDFAAFLQAPPTSVGGPGGMGSALLDTYLSMIAAAGGDTNAMSAALNLQSNAARLAAAAAAAATGTDQRPTNGDGGKESDNEDSMHPGELGSDAENEDEMSESDGGGAAKGADEDDRRSGEPEGVSPTPAAAPSPPPHAMNEGATTAAN